MSIVISCHEAGNGIINYMSVCLGSRSCQDFDRRAHYLTIDIGEEKRGELETVGTHGLKVAHNTTR